jgi:membrane-associated phospholipid phosphatase
MTASRSESLTHPLSWALPLLLLATAGLIFGMGWNQGLFLFINKTIGSHIDPTLWQMLTILGDGAIMLVLMLPLQRSQPKLVLTAILAGVIAGITVHLFKYGLDLPRPPAVIDPQSMIVIGPAYRHQSFPSGHSSTLFAVLATLALGMDGRSLRRRFPFLLLLGALGAISRCGVGVHWPLDVLSGAAMGWLSGLVAHLILFRFTPSARLSVWLGRFLALCAFYVLFFHDTHYADALPYQHVIAIGALCFYFLIPANPIAGSDGRDKPLSD